MLFIESKEVAQSCLTILQSAKELVLDLASERRELETVLHFFKHHLNLERRYEIYNLTGEFVDDLFGKLAELYNKYSSLAVSSVMLMDIILSDLFKIYKNVLASKISMFRFDDAWKDFLECWTVSGPNEPVLERLETICTIIEHLRNEQHQIPERLENFLGWMLENRRSFSTMEVNVLMMISTGLISLNLEYSRKPTNDQVNLYKDARRWVLEFGSSDDYIDLMFEGIDQELRSRWGIAV